MNVVHVFVWESLPAHVTSWQPIFEGIYFYRSNIHQPFWYKSAIISYELHPRHLVLGFPAIRDQRNDMGIQTKDWTAGVGKNDCSCEWSGYAHITVFLSFVVSGVLSEIWLTAGVACCVSAWTVRSRDAWTSKKLHKQIGYITWCSHTRD